MGQLVQPLSGQAIASLILFNPAAPLDAKRSALSATATGGISFRAQSDAGVDALDFMTTTRNGTTTDSIILTVDASGNTTFRVGTGGSFSGTANFELVGSSIVNTGVTPGVYFNETDAGANEKVWRSFPNSNIFTLATRTDANGAGRNAITIPRVGIAVQSITLGNVSDTAHVILPNNNQELRIGTAAQFIHLYDGANAIIRANSGGINLQLGTNVQLGLTTDVATFGANRAADYLVNIDTQSGRNRQVNFTTGGSLRWALRCDSTAESGGNAGSNFSIRARTDAGTALGDAISITRSNGSMTLGFDAANGKTSLVGRLNLQSYTVATLPAGAQGDVAYVTDANAPAFLTAIVGGGAVRTPVFFNGAAWVAF